MNHKRTVVQLSVDMAKRMRDNFGDEIKINMDYLVAGAILIDVGKLLEYEIVDEKLSTSNFGKYVRPCMHILGHPLITDRTLAIMC